VRRFDRDRGGEGYWVSPLRRAGGAADRCVPGARLAPVPDNCVSSAVADAVALLQRRQLAGDPLGDIGGGGELTGRRAVDAERKGDQPCDQSDRAQ
jgi:hypothetical protein